ncbi:Neurogenic locus notch-like protein 1 [Trichoplax sp. H2]|nr:Neurogenic locus notch-like protein 1 [Trichoplax sp. H2]|eukprot:RDD41612.1 Neurogenic locus notch-like protein 1 [Trichoplax sp. H2]
MAQNLDLLPDNQLKRPSFNISKQKHSTLRWYRTSAPRNCLPVARWINNDLHNDTGRRNLCFHFGQARCLRNISIAYKKCSDYMVYKMDKLSVSYLSSCSHVEDNCNQNPCQNGGKCKLIKGGTGYQCQCRLGYHGKTCQIPFNESTEIELVIIETLVLVALILANSVDVLPKEMVIIVNVKPDILEITVKKGNNMLHITAEIFDPCQSNPCHSGVCISENNTYKCRCYPGFHGENCERHYCLPSPCQNGLCSANATGYKCICNTGYYGKRCHLHYCRPDPCRLGICVVKTDGYKCRCLPGYHGTNCDRIDSELSQLFQKYYDTHSRTLGYCDSNPCIHGKCYKTINGYRCQCKPGYYGERCQSR